METDAAPEELPLVKRGKKKLLILTFPFALIAPLEVRAEHETAPNDPVPVQAMDAAEMAPLTASCDAATGPKLPVPVDEIVVQVTPPLPFALNGKVLPLNTLNPPLFVARKPLLLDVRPVEIIEVASTLLALTIVVEMPP